MLYGLSVRFFPNSEGTPIYTLLPTQEFVAEQKAANRRQNNAKGGISSAIEMQNQVEQPNKSIPFVRRDRGNR